MAGQLAPPAAAAVPPCPLHTPPPAPQVMEAAAGNLTPVVLELGGKDAFVVCDDADLNQVGAHALNPLCCGSHASLPSAPSLPPARPLQFFIEKNPTIVNFPVKNLELSACIPVPTGKAAARPPAHSAPRHRHRRGGACWAGLALSCACAGGLLEILRPRVWPGTLAS